MFDFSPGDLLFIVLILLVIHGTMRWVRCQRQRSKNPDSEPTGS